MPKIKTIDLTIFITPVILLAVSVAVIYSLVMGTSNESLWVKQGIIAIIGLLVMLGVSFIDYRQFRGLSTILYIISIFLLILVDVFGKTVNGAMNWLNFGFFQLQPSEVAKVFLIICLAAFFSKRIGKIRWIDILASLLMIALPLALVLAEPDLGTALIICLIYLVMFLISKPTKIQLASLFFFIVLIFGLVAGAYLKVKPLDKLLKDYQRHRVAVFLDPKLEPTKSGYNVKQAQITVGSGGIFGQGLGKGSQSQLRFLPEAHTDFIFSGIAESFGFLGTTLFLALYAFFLLSLIRIAHIAKDNFGMLIVVGTASMFFFQVLISVGMNIGLLPVTGIPLPLLSYGGTSLLVSLFSIGLAQSIYIHHRKITF